MPEGANITGQEARGTAAGTGTPIGAGAGAGDSRRAGNHVCPFCGTVAEKPSLVCMQCGLEDTPGTRQATRSKIGPWFVLQPRNPAAPGMNFATLLGLIQKGRILSRSIVRGPTTHQLWRYASRVKGISREFGVCWGCGATVARVAKVCANCKRLQEPPIDPDVLVEGVADRAVRSPSKNPNDSAAGAPSPAAINSPPAASTTASGARLQVVSLPADARGIEELAAFGLGGPRPRPRRHWARVGQFAGAMVILLAFATAALFYFRPRWWQSPDDWGKPSPRSVPGLVTPSAPSAPAIPARTPPSAANPEKTTIVVGPSHDTPPVAAPGPETVGPTQDVVVGPAPVLTVEEARDSARKLRVEAMAAENKGDYARAVQCWEQIRTLQTRWIPRELWQTDLEAHLNEARQNLQSR